MNTKRIRVRSNAVEDDGRTITILGNDTFFIPKKFILKTSEKEFFNKSYYKPKKEKWTSIYLDPDFFRSQDIAKRLYQLEKKNRIFVYGRRSYGIVWDYVINILSSRPANMCFFCDDTLIRKENFTRDHLIPSVIVEAYGLSFIYNNTVPCCKACNEEKASLHPYIFREKVKLKIRHSRNKEKWRRVLKVLNKILIEKKDPFA